ncbi:MAG: hypothetical protein JWQ16_2660 [Novosphingobium sp.]|nr:hypothetical protein [Novosphingobium sp.]
MKTFMKGVMMASVATMALGLAACDSKKENSAEDQAQSVRESSDAAADKMESQAATVEATTDAKADAVRKAGDAKADAMEDKADTMSSPKSN